MLLVLIYMEKVGKVFSLFFFLLVGFSELFPKANNIGQVLPNLTAYLQYFQRKWILPFPFTTSFQESEPADYTAQSFVRVCFSVTTSLYIHFSPDPQHHLVKTQKNTIPLSMKKVTVHQISKGILWPVSVIHCFKKSSSLSPQSCQNIQLQKRDILKMRYSQIQQEIFFEY